MTRRIPLRQLFGFGGVWIAVILLYELAFASGGGRIYSILSAISAVGAKAPMVEIDANGLRFPIFIALGAIALLLCGLGDFDLNRKWPHLVVVIGIFGGGIIITAMYAKPVVTRYMTAHGYSRCTARDHRMGHGKGSIWFDDYVLAPADCRTG